jgi:hypothetical protein
MRMVGRRTASAVRRDIFVAYDANKIPSPVRGGIFWRPSRAMSLLRSYGIFEHGFYKYAAPNGAERRTSRVKLGAIRSCARFLSLPLAWRWRGREVRSFRFKVQSRRPWGTPARSDTILNRRLESLRNPPTGMSALRSAGFPACGFRRLFSRRCLPQPAHTIKTSARMRPSGLAITKRTCRVRGFPAFIFANHHLYER